MQLAMGDGTKTMFKGVLVNHKDETLTYEAKFKYHCGDNTKDLFEGVNEYLDSLSSDTKEELFDLYREALQIIDPTYFGVENARKRSDVDNNNNYVYLISEVAPIVARIYELLNLRNYRNFVRQSGWCEPPKGLRETIARGEYSSDMTINPDDYRNIAELGLVLRPLLPIFSQMIMKVEKITGSDYREVVTGGLINTIPEITSHPGWIKIRSYVSNFYSSKGINPLQLSVISEDSYASHASYIAMFTRLCCAHIPSIDNRKNLAKVIYSVVRQFDTGSSNIREKNLKGFDELNEKRGVHEVYQIKEDVNAADIETQGEFFTMKHYDENDKPIYKDRYIHQCRALGIDNPQLPDIIYDMIPGWEFELEPHVLQLMQLVFKDDISYQIYEYLDYEQLMSALTLASVKLHQMGYPLLSQIVLSVYNPTGMKEDTRTIFDLTQEEKESLLNICGVFKTKDTVSTDNELIIAVNEFLSRLGNGAWQSIIEVGMPGDKESLDNSIKGYLYEVELCREIKTELINLILELS